MTDRQLQDMLRALAAHDERQEPSDRVERAVMSRWAEHVAAPPEVSVPREHVANRAAGAERYMAVGVGIAAALVLIAWLAGRESNPGPPASPAAEIAVAPPPTETVLATPVVEKTSLVPESYVGAGFSRPDPATTRRARVAASNRPAIERVESFSSLQPLTERDLYGVRVARIRLSGQAAERLGFMPPGVVLGAEPIEADVLLGEDGMARAIRFVR